MQIRAEPKGKLEFGKSKKQNSKFGNWQSAKTTKSICEIFCNFLFLGGWDFCTAHPSREYTPAKRKVN
jgi:hypothetical protein